MIWKIHSLFRLQKMVILEVPLLGKHALEKRPRVWQHNLLKRLVLWLIVAQPSHRTWEWRRVIQERSVENLHIYWPGFVLYMETHKVVENVVSTEMSPAWTEGVRDRKKWEKTYQISKILHAGNRLIEPLGCKYELPFKKREQWLQGQSLGPRGWGHRGPRGQKLRPQWCVLRSWNFMDFSLPDFKLAWDQWPLYA